MPYPRHPVLAASLLAAVATALLLPAPVGAQVRRCTTPDGGTVYTDRSCATLGAVETRPNADGGLSPGSAPRYRGGCARRLQDLVFEVTSAIDARDTNWLARSYHWAGMGHRNGYAVLERLDAIARRPLLNVTALRPARTIVVPSPDTAPTAAAAPAGPAPLSALVTGTAASSLAPPPAPPAPRRPVALRIDQVLSDGVTPSTTTFGLRRHMDCWWISL